MFSTTIRSFYNRHPIYPSGEKINHSDVSINLHINGLICPGALRYIGFENDWVIYFHGNGDSYINNTVHHPFQDKNVLFISHPHVTFFNILTHRFNDNTMINTVCGSIEFVLGVKHEKSRIQCIGHSMGGAFLAEGIKKLMHLKPTSKFNSKRNSIVFDRTFKQYSILASHHITMCFIKCVERLFFKVLSSRNYNNLMIQLKWLENRLNLFKWIFVMVGIDYTTDLDDRDYLIHQSSISSDLDTMIPKQHRFCLDNANTNIHVEHNTPLSWD